MEKNFCCFMIFMMFNILFLFNGFGIIGGGVYLIILISYNTLSVMMIVIGIIIILIFSIGFTLKKNQGLLILYLLFLFIFILFYAGLSLMLYLYPDLLIEFIKKKITENKEIDNIPKAYKTILFIITCVGASCCFLTFLTGSCLCCNSKNKNKDILIDDIHEGDCLHGIDYSQIDNSNTSN